MSDKVRLAVGGSLLVVGGAIVAVLAVKKPQPPLDSSLAPAFEIMGTPIQALNHLVTRVMPVDALDEAQLGNVISRHYEATTDTTGVDFRYVNEILDGLDDLATKPFPYRAFLLDWAVPNAMALPGGVILVTTGLLETVGSEAELASILGHELGHIERSHVLDAVRFRLLAEKIEAEPLGRLADFAVRALIGHSFSKTQEDDADHYGFQLILVSPYDPYGMSSAFRSLLDFRDETRAGTGNARANLFRDYFSSHPPLEIRERVFRERAEAWWGRNSGEDRTLGEGHMAERVSVYRAIKAQITQPS